MGADPSIVSRSPATFGRVRSTGSAGREGPRSPSARPSACSSIVIPLTPSSTGIGDDAKRGGTCAPRHAQWHPPAGEGARRPTARRLAPAGDDVLPGLADDGARAHARAMPPDATRAPGSLTVPPL